jgi:hypothetical protein
LNLNGAIDTDFTNETTAALRPPAGFFKPAGAIC